MYFLLKSEDPRALFWGKIETQNRCPQGPPLSIQQAKQENGTRRSVHLGVVFVLRQDLPKETKMPSLKASHLRGH